MSFLQTDLCEICGSNLIAHSDNTKELECFFCKKQFEANISCPKGHYICDSCHSKKAREIMLEYCMNTTESNPYIITDLLLKHPSVNMYGPEHHILVPLVLLSMIKNLNLVNKNGNSITPESFLQAYKRAKTIPGGWCGFFGACGAAIGGGVAISVFTESNPSKKIERSQSNMIVSKSLSRISDDLEHCCKRSVKIAIEEGIKMVEKIVDQQFDFTPDKCPFGIINSRCSGNKCPYF